MKKTVVAVLILWFSAGAFAQEISENAIGLRLGDSDGLGAEINYQRAVGSENNRLEFGLGLRSNDDVSAFKLVGLYEWVWNIDGGFNWYTGPGSGIGSISIENARFENGRFEDDSETFIFIAGIAGIEYNFDIPLLLSLDVRPEFGLGNFRDDLDLDIALSVRFQF